MKNKKKIIAVIIAVITLITLSACSDNNEPSVITVRTDADSFVEDSIMLERFAQHPERYTENLTKDFGMSEKEAEEFYECPEEWLLYSQTVSIHNGTDETIRICGFEVKDNGKNGVYISTATAGEPTVASNMAGETVFSVLCENGDLTTAEAEQLVKEFEIKVLYTKEPTELEDGSESVEETKTANLDFA